MNVKLNRIKAILAEQQKTSKWLAPELGVNVATVSKWCTNRNHPDPYMLSKIASLLKINIKELLNNSTNELD